MEGQEPTSTGQEPETTTNAGAQGGQEQKPNTQATQGDPSTASVDANAPVKVEDLPANVQKLIKDLRGENATHRKAKETAEKEAQEAKERQLAEQNQWKELAEERGKQIDGFKTKAEQYDKLSPILSKQLEDEINAWPEKVRNLFPANEMSVIEMMEWANRFRPLAQEMAGEQPPPPGNGRRPPPVSSAGHAKAADEQRTNWQRQAARRYK